MTSESYIEAEELWTGQQPQLSWKNKLITTSAIYIFFSPRRKRGEKDLKEFLVRISR